MHNVTTHNNIHIQATQHRLLVQTLLGSSTRYLLYFAEHFDFLKFAWTVHVWKGPVWFFPITQETGQSFKYVRKMNGWLLLPGTLTDPDWINSLPQTGLTKIKPYPPQHQYSHKPTLFNRSHLSKTLHVQNDMMIIHLVLKIVNADAILRAGGNQKLLS